MATILEWQSHITDSTDRDTILVNINALEHLANGIMGDTSLSANFATLREGIKTGTIAPDQWTQDNSFKVISTKLTNHTTTLTQDLSTAKTDITKKLDASTYKNFIAGDFKTASDRLDSAEGTLQTHTTALGNKLEASTFNSFKKKIGTLPTDKTLAEELRERPSNKKVSEMINDRDRKTYTVKVFIDGQIRNGKMDVGNPKDPTTQQQAVLHYAQANNLLMGKAAADFYNSLKWTVNKGRTTDPKERTVTGSRCYVLAKDIVTPTDGSAPYYDIQLERLT